MAHFLAALEDDRLEAHLCQQQPGEDPAGTEAHHDWPLSQAFRRLAHHLVADIRCRVDVAVVGKLEQQRGFTLHVQVDGVDEAQLRGLFTRIVAALEQGEIEQVITGDAQALHDGSAQVFFGMVDGQLEFGDS